MLTIQPFDWRRLSAHSQMEHRLAADGTLRLRGLHPDEAPLDLARVFPAGMDPYWERPADRDGWILRRSKTSWDMRRIVSDWGGPARSVADPLGIDERAVLVLIQCETGGVLERDADGYVKAPRTAEGYPEHGGDRDKGDFFRDAEDWRASRGMYSSHGLMNTRIGDAMIARPDLFASIEPTLYRSVLWVPENSLACALAHVANYPSEVLADPLLFRIRYRGHATVEVSPATKWGLAPICDDRVLLRFIAFWNDDACVRAGTCATPPPPTPPPSMSSTRTSSWSTGGLAFAFALGAAAAASVTYVATTRRFPC